MIAKPPDKQNAAFAEQRNDLSNPGCDGINSRAQSKGEMTMARVSVSMGIDDAGAASKGLKSGALGLLSSIVMAIASTAPAYSLAATLGVVAIAVGIYSPAIMILAFLPMLFIAIAYQELNQDHPDCGTTFTWAAKGLGPRAGWMGGWGIIAADIIVMANLAQIAGSYSFRLVGL